MSSDDAQRDESQAGFTLIEMMAVMMITALLAGLVVTFTSGTGRPGLKAVVMQAVALLRRERLGALLTGSDRHVALDEVARVLIGEGGDQVAIPKDVAIDVLGLNEVWAGRQAVAAFHPDGASSGGALKFSRDGVAYEVRVNWYTGAVAIQVP